jgi:hypothetical protein
MASHLTAAYHIEVQVIAPNQQLATCCVCNPTSKSSTAEQSISHNEAAAVAGEAFAYDEDTHEPPFAATLATSSAGLNWSSTAHASAS